MKNNIVVLASASPRRTEILSQAGIAHLVMPAVGEEVPISGEPSEVVEDLSRQKAEEVYGRYEREHPEKDFTVIGADTVVAADGKILGKPASREQAVRMIALLQGRSHQVYTGVTILSKFQGEKKQNTFFECSYVDVYDMTQEEIENYVDTKESMDKAGGYAIQGKFAPYIRRIEGDYYNIVGLPIGRLYHEWKQMEEK